MMQTAGKENETEVPMPRNCSWIGWTLVLVALLALFGSNRLDLLGIVAVVSLLLACLIAGTRNHARSLTKGSQKG